MQRLYKNVYKPALLKDLWFQWKGKPLLLCPPEAVTPDIDSAFTTRQSWAWSKGQKWFGDGKDKWTWADNAPADGDPLHWLDKGDAAPNARFRYRYVKQ